MSSLYYTDNYGDTLDIRISSGYESTYIEAEEVDGSSTQLEFDRDRLATIAKDILTELGESGSTNVTNNVSVINSPVAELTDTTDVREAWNSTAVDNAKLLRLGVSFRYVKNAHSEPVQRQLSRVTDVIDTSEGHALVVGFDDDRDDYRSYRLDRIKGYISVLD